MPSNGFVESSDSGEIKLLVSSLAGEASRPPICQALEIISVCQRAPLPIFSGVVQVRGEASPIANVRGRVGLGSPKGTRVLGFVRPIEVDRV